MGVWTGAAETRTRRALAGRVPRARLVRLARLVLGVALVATACAPAVVGPAFAPRARPLAGGELYVYRVDGVPSQGKAYVRIEDASIAKLSNGEYTWFALPAGSHVVKLQFRRLPWAWGWDAIPIELNDGGVLYLRVAGGVQQTRWRAGAYETGGPSSEEYGAALFRSFVPAESALPELRGCRLTTEVGD